jgi:hypothetical protein
MKKTHRQEIAPLCPSAQPDMSEAVVFAVAAGTAEERRADYLDEPLPITEKVLELTAPVKPVEVFRVAAPCAGLGCKHFNGLHCTLAQRIVEHLSPAVDQPPPCRIRSNCRWWQQEGKSACLRCPQIVTETAYASDLYRRVSTPPTVTDGQADGEQRPPEAR